MIKRVAVNTPHPINQVNRISDGRSAVTLAAVNVLVNRFRWLVLLLGPFPILGVSVFLTQWAEGETHASPNEVVSSLDARYWSVLHDDRDPELRAACDKAAQRLSEQLSESCEVIVHTPFVIGGDMSEEELERWYVRTIRPASVALADSYLEASPNQPITVLLFTNRETYNAYAEELFKDRGISVYGYYKPTIRTLIMNIGTGGGTLVHELTHALVDFDFDGIPDWFNEGLASLHEQCRFRQTEGRHWIEGLTNWRLASLQAAIQDEELDSVRTLIANPDFRGRHVGLNYAHARYFCMYLQHQGKLAEFYQTFRNGFEDDPTGETTLQQVLQVTSWKELDDDFRRWVLTLRFDR